ncbi:acyl-CoA dehydrogenase family protein [Mycolicibacterium fortuitum]|uniref:Acyl-CoA dehydrogenase domain-containing protein n=1 Tax=Mycolicibacterium fortuitum subsp. fortuitum DSM 46621 = ATCC 6841 = JCM 6387 TaxID=1214102 RepID=K0UWK0_MYCFO|nr:acyl-CoA dehydrogenase family protein [Mycolicibacterium fortuitum]AIY47997.1 Butyryl-CoA dehydrogenase [Mycobacterium sp. VKM Ac-1817D]CRL82809.1 acyl-CoA dehydrogenase FadE2 [Mycolicibacter nonchromogenicus]EJZ06953.1 acyl-CoA dehydrogenase domain-containing protein [Mycolicibacterium fortuitum subsp. fortuitum DSM 46621 = ATCC 6841 = JCM 6387]WEV31602.1 acyl-CoA dehydrogenase family protein [Mycolicibacterium fortuitum]CRL52779.1 acyl-CoA dehydrogenase FadE2 [Mycolicibacterium fortuitum 
MDFEPSDRAQEYLERVNAFIDCRVAPAESRYEQQRRDLAAAGTPHEVPGIIEGLKAEARARGLWNLFLPTSTEPAHGLSVLDYAPLAERTGWYPQLAPEAMNCSAPDTGNMELLNLFATEDQRERWLNPLLRGAIRSAFAMTEPDVASSDAGNIATTIRIEGDEIVINGRKWWTTGALDPRTAFYIVMGISDPEADRSSRHSFAIVPVGTPGVSVVRDLSYYGFTDQNGHGEVRFVDVRVPRTNLIGAPGTGFAMAQARLGPGRVHHCMRAIGMAERGISLMKQRAAERVTFGQPLASQGVIREWIADARITTEQLRLLVLKTAWLIDRHGAGAARTEIAAIKVAVPRGVCRILDDAVQIFGGAGVTADTPLASLWAAARTMRIADGPDEVHLRSIARAELERA